MTKKVILITDGDETARKAVETAGHQLGLRTISRSAGNPTPRSGEELIDLIKQAKSDVVLVMFDDQGDEYKGEGEEALEVVLADDGTEVLGILAVASHTKSVWGIKPDFAINNQGRIVKRPVNKDGELEPEGHIYLEGDTVDVINKFKPSLVVGIGDIGKMNEQDSLEEGCPITTKAINEILCRSEI